MYFKNIVKGIEVELDLQGEKIDLQIVATFPVSLFLKLVIK